MFVCDSGGSALSRCNLDVCAGVALFTFSHSGSESGAAEGRRLDAGTRMSAIVFDYFAAC